MRIFSLFIQSFICVFISGPLCSQPNQDDQILYWSKQRTLTFEDFRGSPEKDTVINSEALPHKHGTIVKAIDVKVLTRRGQTTFTILAGMKRNLSWIKEVNDSISLRHEQGHFDICEVFARVLRREIKSATSLAQARDIYERILVEEEAEHDKYDSANTFGAGGIINEWKKSISKRLEELESYKNPVVVIPVDK